MQNRKSITLFPPDRRRPCSRRLAFSDSDSEFAGDLLFADRSLVVIEEIEPSYLERAIVSAITRADAAVVSHDVEPVLTVDSRIDRTNRFAGRVLAVLAHHWLMHHLGVLRKFAVVFVERFRARVVAIDPEPVHRSTMTGL